MKLEEKLLKKIDILKAQIEDMKCCQNCKHYSISEGKIECKTCFAKDHTNWQLRYT